MSIEFGAGPVGYQGDKDEKIREVVKKIEKETEEAGLPWWAGLFNQEIVKLASAEGCECNCTEGENKSTGRGGCDCVKEERERELREKIEKVKAENERIRGELEERREKLRRADEAVVKAIESASESVEWGRRRLEEKEMNIYEQSTTMEWMVKNAETVAKLRQSMNGMPFYGV